MSDETPQTTPDEAPASHRYFNKNNGHVVEYPRPHSRFETLQNWVKIESDEHLAELQKDNDRNGRGNLLGSANVGDRIEERHQVPAGTFEPKVEFTEPSFTQLRGQHPDPEDFHPEKQPEVITVDPSQQVEPKTGEGKHEFTQVEAPAPVEPTPQRTLDAQSDETFADNPTTEAKAPAQDTTGPDPAERPARSATKAEWVDWAVKCGADKTEAEGMTKADLISTYDK